jgi:hypothetical protein
MKKTNSASIISVGSSSCPPLHGDPAEMTESMAEHARDHADSPCSGRQDVPTSITIERYFDFQK